MSGPARELREAANTPAVRPLKDVSVTPSGIGIGNDPFIMPPRGGDPLPAIAYT